MSESKRFVGYDANTIIDLKLVKSWVISSGDVDLLLKILNNENEAKKLCESKKTGVANERFIVDDAGTLIDMVTRETYDIVEEVVDLLNYYENNCLRYEQIISELKDGTYKEPLPITQKK